MAKKAAKSKKPARGTGGSGATKSKSLKRSRSPLQQLDIGALPTAENERFEYKSSATPPNALKDKLTRAASGFWNSGGGVFIGGVDGTGKPDGGLPATVGRTPVRDWIDQVLKEVSPVGAYSVRLFPHDPTSGLNIAASQCVIAVEFEESARPPHMAPDHKYYIRAGAHTVPATHYIVEALWARRRVQHPQLAHTMRLKPEASDIIQLAILPLTEEPAINVTIAIDPLPEMWKDSKAVFPLKLPLLDRTTPFYLDITTYFAAEERLGQGIHLQVEYEDLARNCYEYTAILDIKSIAPWTIGTPANEKIAKSLESIDNTLKAVPKAIDELNGETAQVRGRLETMKSVAFPGPIAEVGEIATQLSADAIAVILAAKKSGTISFTPFIGGWRLSAGNTQFSSIPGSHREEARWKSAILELRDLGLVDGVFKRGASTLFRVTKLGYEIADAVKPLTDGAPHIEGGKAGEQDHAD